MVLWQEHADEISRAVRLAVQEPITESDYRAQIDASRSEWVPIDELADIAAGDHEGWTDAEMETVEGWDEPVVRQEAWDRVAAGKEKELRALVAAGKLSGRGRGTALKVQLGAFHDLTGRPMGAVPEQVLTYRVLPDSEAEAVATERRRLEWLHDAVAWQSGMEDREGTEPVGIDRLREYVLQGLVVNMSACWLAVREAEIVIDEAAEEFDGIDPLRPWARTLLDECKASLLEVNRHLECIKMEVELPEPSEEDIAELREIARRPTS